MATHRIVEVCSGEWNVIYPLGRAANIWCCLKVGCNINLFVPLGSRPRCPLCETLSTTEVHNLSYTLKESEK